MADFVSPFATREETGATEESFEASGAVSSIIPAGRYSARLVDLQSGISKSSNAPMWTFTFSLLEAGEFDNWEIKTWASLNESAIWKRNQIVVALGLAKPGPDGRINVSFKRKDAIGRLATLVIKHEDYRGSMTAKIASVEPYVPVVSTSSRVF